MNIKMALYTLLLLVSLLSISCNQVGNGTQEEAKIELVNVDSLTATFLAGWNNKDSAAIMQTVADNAVVMNDSLIHTGVDVIAKNWISGGVKVLSNIMTTSSIQGASDMIAFDGGIYTLDLNIPGGPILKEKGNYSLVWTKQANGKWLLSLVHIEDITRLPDIQ